uniref:Uncharacterized protein n=1 Tax=Romanomermis culicivorax TaxID=13658 RepID=A0A915IS56_ROMCU
MNYSIGIDNFDDSTNFSSIFAIVQLDDASDLDVFTVHLE